MRSQPRPIKALFSLQEMYTLLSAVMEQNCDEAPSLLEFGNLIVELCAHVLPDHKASDPSYLVEVLCCYVEPEQAADLLDYFLTSLKAQFDQVGLPQFTEPGFCFRYYVQGGIMLVVMYTRSQGEINQPLPQTHHDIINAIERGDYVSEKVKQQWGLR